MSDWYVTRGEQERGPLSWDQVRRFAATGKLRPDDLLREGFGSGRPAREYEDLPFPDPNAAQVPAPKPALSSLGWRRPERPIEPQDPPSLGPVSIPMFFGGAVILVGALVGWVYWAESRPPGLVQLPGGVQPRPTTFALPTDEEALAFGDRVLTCALSGTPREQELLDFAAFADRAVVGLPVPPRAKQSLAEGMQRTGLLSRLREGLGDDLDLRVLRVREVAGEKLVLVRAAGEGVNYLEFSVGKRGDGSVRAHDVYVFLTGERISETLRTVMIPMAAEMNRSVLDKLAGKDAVFLKHATTLEAMTQAFTVGDPGKVLTLYATLPKEVAEMKLFQLNRYRAATACLEGAEFTRTMDDIRRILGDDPRLELLYIDNYVAKGEFDQALAAMARLRDETGDPYLLVMRSGVFLRKGALDDAQSEARKAIDEERELSLAWAQLILCQIEAKAFDDVLATLEEMEEEFPETDWDAFFQTKEYAPFVDTPQYREWLAYLKEGETPAPRKKRSR